MQGCWISSTNLWQIKDIRGRSGIFFPKSFLQARMPAALQKKGQDFWDPDGNLEAGIPLCPPEGDAGTGMTATNSVAVRTGNVSAGTSVFAMAVLEKDLTRPYEEIDLVTTPSGDLVAMVHCNNCTSDLNGLGVESSENSRKPSVSMWI